MNDLKLLPRPKHWERPAGGGFTVPAGPLSARVPACAAGVGSLLACEWQRETGRTLSIASTDATAWCFALGKAPEAAAPVPGHGEGYTLDITPGGVAARANSRRGLLHAWQTLKQILRHDPNRLPALHITDWPDLDWRVYHVDLKGVRRSLANLHTILPDLAELKINAVLVEYENNIRLERHPDLALPDALDQADVRRWAAAAGEYGIAVIPLVQTLGHLQYVLDRPAYARLQEKPGDPAEACVSHPDTWPLVRDFLDEIMQAHPGAPFIHVGLDETAHVGTCPRCAAERAGRPRVELYVAWLNRVCRHVADRGFVPMAWGDVVASELAPEQLGTLNRQAVYLDWNYTETGPAAPFLRSFKGGRFSREWLRRPEGEIAGLPRLGFGAGSRLLEDLPPEDQAEARSRAANPEFPRQFRTWTPLSQLAGAGLACGAVSGLRASFHGCMAPRFVTGQLNTIAAADACRRTGARLLVGSSWSRGHSLAGVNAPPELDWYGIATLADAGWSPLAQTELRDFDRRFAFQFFGLPDGHIGDLLYLVERSSPRVDHVTDNYLPYVAAECGRCREAVVRNRERFDLFADVVALQQLRQRAQFALLEMEYFHATWTRVPAAFKKRIADDIRATRRDIEAGRARMQAVYAGTMPAADAAELVATQLGFACDAMRLMAGRMFGEEF